MSCNTFVIRHLTSGFVLDASDEHVKIDYFTGSPFQKWVMETAQCGFSVFVNTGNGKVLDVTDNGSKVITFTRHGGSNQQWRVNCKEQTIESAKQGLALDVCSGRYVTGNNIIGFRKHGKDNQKFYFQYC